ncbi:hypothetical protein RB196_35405 [Streptomyces sp. PmtA]|uniref:hypothetical protein n=1 Tax=Streptomyces sp. PmtA TaxID=3074275 RepID=UPI0030152347
MFLAGTSGDEITEEGFTIVFDSPLLPADGRLVVGDVVGRSRFPTSLVGKPGRHRVTVAVDNPNGPARAVDVMLGEIPQ